MLSATLARAWASCTACNKTVYKHSAKKNNHSFIKQATPLLQKAHIFYLIFSVKKGGVIEATEGRKCLCNALMANAGMPQVGHSLYSFYMSGHFMFGYYLQDTVAVDCWADLQAFLQVRSVK